MSDRRQRTRRRSVRQPYFEVLLDAPLSDWMKEAPRHPMFILEGLRSNGWRGRIVRMRSWKETGI